MFDLTGKVVLLTGATGGIGKSIAKKMKEQGAKLILSGTRQNILNELSYELGNSTKVIASDFTSKAKVSGLQNTKLAKPAPCNPIICFALLNKLSLIHI